MKDKTCTLLFLIKNDEILLAMKKRGFGAGRYNGVGGKVDEGETLEQALVRECQEEINVTPLNYWKVAEHHFKQDVNTDPYDLMVHTYFCDKWQGEPTETEEMAPEWVKQAAIPYDTMWQDDKFWLPLVLEGKKVKCEFTFDNADNLLAHTIQEVNDFGEANL